MKTQNRFIKLLLIAAVLSIGFSACDKSAEKVKGLEADLLAANMAKDSLQTLLTNETKGEGDLKCLVKISEKEAFEMIDNYNPKKDGAVRSITSYYLHTKYLLKKYKSHIYTTIGKMKDGRLNVVISVWDNDAKTWVYYTINLDCGNAPAEKGDGNGYNPSGTDTCCAPTCPPSCACPPNPPSVCRGG